MTRRTTPYGFIRKGCVVVVCKCGGMRDASKPHGYDPTPEQIAEDERLAKERAERWR